MATKKQLIEFIIETFVEANGEEIAKSKLESYRKADLEEFIDKKGAKADLEVWLNK